MANAAQAKATAIRTITKCPTGIRGLDEITGGGLPKGRVSLISGGAGCGKTVLAIEFLVRGVTQYDEPGVFMSFEEDEQDLIENFGSFEFNLVRLQKRLLVDHFQLDPSETNRTGERDLEPLFLRLGNAIARTGARRVVLDTIEALYSSSLNVASIRSGLRHLFEWLKTAGITAVVTAEKPGDGNITRYGIEEFVSDCVMILDHRVLNQVSTRRIRILKYRGTTHGNNEYPFMIGKSGISVLPISSLKLEHKLAPGIVPSGIRTLDEMLRPGGFYRGSSVLISGSAGTGKTTVAAYFIQAACKRGERSLYLASEQSSDEIVRNMLSVGIDLRPFIQKRLLRIYAERPSSQGLEQHLAGIHDLTLEFRPRVVVMDPITNYTPAGTAEDIQSMFTRLIDFFKSEQITALFTSVMPVGESRTNGSGLSTQMDVCVNLRVNERSGRRRRLITIIKSRGMAHSEDVREFVITNDGIRILKAQFMGQG